MSLWSEVYTPAMLEEEAALLPARTRSAAGKSALMDAMRKADAMLEKKLSNAVIPGNEGAVLTENVNRYAFSGSRAALHQVRPKW